MTEIRIPKGKPMSITYTRKVGIGEDNTYPLKQGSREINTEPQKTGSNDYSTTDNEKSYSMINTQP
jgi:hypothetical protein